MKKKSKNMKNNFSIKDYMVIIAFIASALFIIFLFKMTFGDTQNIIKLSNNTIETKSKVDTILGLSTYIGEKITVNNEGQQEIMKAIMETQRMIKQNGRDIAVVKRELSQRTLLMNTKVATILPPKSVPIPNKTSYEKSLDSFFKSRLKTTKKGA